VIKVYKLSYEYLRKYCEAKNIIRIKYYENIEVYASFNVSEPLQKITKINFKSDAAPALKCTAC
jgi:hypothetical protein